MNTFKSKNPVKNEVQLDVIDTFLEQQNTFLDVLQKASEYDLNTNKCKLTIPMIKMNLGATLQFIIFHNVRHIEQARRKVPASVLMQ